MTIEELIEKITDQLRGRLEDYNREALLSRLVEIDNLCDEYQRAR